MEAQVSQCDSRDQRGGGRGPVARIVTSNQEQGLDITNGFDVTAYREEDEFRMDVRGLAVQSVHALALRLPVLSTWIRI